MSKHSVQDASSTRLQENSNRLPLAMRPKNSGPSSSRGSKPIEVLITPKASKTSGWLLRVLVLVGVMGSVYIIYALRHHALNDEHRLSFGGKGEVVGIGAQKQGEGKHEEASASIRIADSTTHKSEPLKKDIVHSERVNPRVETVVVKKAPPAPLPSQPSATVMRSTKTAKVKEEGLYERVDYSGLYRADGEHESYAGAWLAPKKRLVDSYRQLNQTSNLEGSTMAVSGYGRRQDPRITFMTRDFFDFQVLHLSVTTNFIDSIGRGGSPAKLNQQLVDRVREQMVQTVQQLEKPLDTMRAHGDPRLTEQTIALIPFTGFAASTDKSEFQASIRKLYFKATFYSVYRYIRSVIVTVPTQNDYEVLRSMNLPVWKILNFKERYNLKVNTEHPLSTVRLPKHSIMYVVNKMRTSKEYAKFAYVYYTEQDLVLHMRSEKQLMDALDRSSGNFAAAPHRMQSNPLPKAYPKELQALWAGSSGVHFPHHFHLQSLKDVKLETEDAYMPKGSCCDNGRFDFRDCGNWWYYCPKYGLANFTTWIRFGENGFTLPLGTEHRARCEYSRVRKTCGMPRGCSKRVPDGVGQENICGEMPNISRVGY